MNKAILMIAGLVLTGAVAHASDTITVTGSNPIAGTLKIPQVQLGSTLYNDVTVDITVNKIDSVGGSAPAPSSPLFGMWIVVCPAATCGSEYSVIFTFNGNGTYSATETVMDGSFTSTETGTLSGSYSGAGSTISLTAATCHSIGSNSVTGCDTIGVPLTFKATIFGAGAGSTMTLVGTRINATAYKISN